MSWSPRSFLALVTASMASWLERRSAVQIEYLKAENRALRARLGTRRVLFSNAERRTLATLAKAIGSRAMAELNPIVSPATLLRWHRELVAEKWTFLERRRPGRPRTKIDIEQLVVRMATDNPSWGYTRIHGALMNVDIKVGRGTIRRILKDHLIEPGPCRGRHLSWSVFLKAHWRTLAASDFFTVEVWSWKGLITVYVLFVMDLSTRRVTLCGMTTNPNEAWMLQISRGLFDDVSGALRGKRHLIVDRDTKYSEQFRAVCAREGVEVIRLPPRSPNLNAFAERFVRSIKEECVSKIIPIGMSMLRRSLREFVEHYHLERNHQGCGNELLVPRAGAPALASQITRRSRLGGMLNFYQRAAA